MMRNARLTMLSGTNNDDGSSNTSHMVLLWSRHLLHHIITIIIITSPALQARNLGSNKIKELL